MGKKLNDPLGLRAKLSTDTDVAEEQPVQASDLTDDPLGIRAKLKKKDLTVSEASSESGTTTQPSQKPSSASEPQPEPSKKNGEGLIDNIFSGLYDLGRKAISVFANEAPATIATEKAIEQPTDFIDELIKKHPEKYAVTNEFASPETRRKYAEKIADQEFPGWRESKEVMTPEGKILKTGPLYTESATRRKQEYLSEAEKQKQQGEKFTEGIPKTWEEAKANGSKGILSYIGSAIGNGLGQIPLSAATLGTSSYLMEKSGAYDEAVDAIAKENGLTKEQVVKNNLDQPAKDIAHIVGLVNGGIDAASSLFTVGKATSPIKNIIKKKANEELLKRIPKQLLEKGLNYAAAPLGEYATEFAQETNTQIGAQLAAGKKLEDIDFEKDIDWNRSREAGLQGLIGSTGVVGAGKILNPKQTIEEAKNNIKSSDDQNTINEEASKIVESLKQQTNESNNKLGTQTQAGLGTEVQEPGTQTGEEGSNQSGGTGSLHRAEEVRGSENVPTVSEGTETLNPEEDVNSGEIRKENRDTSMVESSSSLGGNPSVEKTKKEKDVKIINLSDKKLSNILTSDPDNLSQEDYEIRVRLKEHLKEFKASHVLPNIEKYFKNTPKEQRVEKGDVIQFIKEKIIQEQNAIQEQSASSILQHPQEGVGKTGSGRQRMEPSLQGQETTTTRSEEQREPGERSTEEKVSQVITQATSLYDQIQTAEGASKKRRLAQERRTLLEANPSVKYIDDNIQSIYQQLEEKKLITKKGNCP